MIDRFKALAFHNIAKQLDYRRPVGEIIRPPHGWLRAVREGLGLTLREVAARIGVSAPAIRSFERSEAEDRITLASLKRVAGALGCDLVYVLLPRKASFEELADHEARQRVAPHIEATEHSMALEAQASHDVVEKVARETRRKRGLS